MKLGLGFELFLRFKGRRVQPGEHFLIRAVALAPNGRGVQRSRRV